jgi:GMC oxidoreductase/FAD binding domain
LRRILPFRQCRVSGQDAMIDERPTFGTLNAFAADVCVIGGGPVGIITALELCDKGFRVLLLESGGRTPTAEAQALQGAENISPGNHHDPKTTVARRLGGTSNLWGGRCLPHDAIDFEDRPWVDQTAWPIRQKDLAPYLGKACEKLGAGRAVFSSPLAGVTADASFSVDSLERWSNVPRMQVLHKAALEETPSLYVALGATALGFDYDENGRITAIRAHLQTAGEGRIAVTRVILAAGGNESTRLLLSEQRARPDLFGDHLGRYYMGHVNGCIAGITFDNQALHDGLDFHIDAHGSYVRRRIQPGVATQQKNNLANVAFWPVVPEIADPSHRCGPLSAVFLALSTAPIGRRLLAEPIRVKHVGLPPYKRAAHIANMLRDPLTTIGFAPWFIWKTKVAKPRLPGLFLKNPAQRYGLEYHSEHLPSADSRLTLSNETDALGLPRLKIDLRFSEADAASVVRAHDAIETWLTDNKLARLTYRMPPDQRAAAILNEAKHGAHQIGTIRMAASRDDGIVDGTCRAFDVPNLHVISTAVLRTSSHGNPTVTAVQLGLRLADQMAAGAGSK